MKLIADIQGHRQEFALKEGVNVIGRDLSCDVTLLAKSISRRHVAVTVQDQRCFIRDLGSRNGLIIGGERVTEAEVKPGDELIFGKVPVRIALGTTVGDDQPVPVKMPEMQREIVVPRAEGYHEDADPTPVDSDFAPESQTEESQGMPLTVDEDSAVPNALARIDDDAAVPAEAQPLDAPLPKRPMSRREKVIIFVPAAAVVLVILAVLAVTVMNDKPDTQGLMLRASYNNYIGRALELYNEGNEAKALDLLGKLAQKRVQGDPLTAQMFADAIKRSQGLEKPDVFKDRWDDANYKWNEIELYSKTTVGLGELAKKKQAWIGAESINMTNYNAFVRLYEKGELTQALEAATKVPDDSIFSELIAKQVEEVRTKLITEAAQRAEQHQQRGQWSAAIKAYDEVAAMVDPVPKTVIEGRRQCEQNLSDQRKIAQARTLLDSGKYDEAQNALDSVQPEGPYASDYKQIMGIIRTAEIRKNAVTLYNAKKADEALAVLKRAGLQNDALYRKMEQVRDAWAKADAAIKNNEFDTAKKHCQDIVRLEKNAQNGFLFEAKQFLANAEQRATELAQEIRRAGVKAYEARDFRLARSKFEEAARMDPKGRVGRDDIESLKKEAGREYNRAVNLIDRQPKEALKIFKEVKARLKPGDPYYDTVDDRLRRMEG